MDHKSLLGNPKKMRNRVFTMVAMALLLAFLFIADNTTLLDAYTLQIMMLCAIYGIAAMSLNLINGVTGQFSLGQAGFMALGAYATALLTVSPQAKEAMYYVVPVAPWVRDLQAPFFVALLVGGLLAAFFAFLIGFPVLRLKSDYLAIATLGFSEIIRVVIVNATPITNSSMGIKGIPQIANIWWCVAALVVIAYLILKLLKTSYGRAFKAIRDDEIAAEAMGITLFRHKMVSFMISAFIAGISGGLIASVLGIVTPMFFRFTLTYEILLITVLGGQGSISGSILAALVITSSKEILRFLDEGFKIGGFQFPAIGGMRMFAFSLMLMVVILFFRNGFFGTREFTWNGLVDGFVRIGKWFVRLYHKLFSKKSSGGNAV